MHAPNKVALSSTVHLVVQDSKSKKDDYLLFIQFISQLKKSFTSSSPHLLALSPRYPTTRLGQVVVPSAMANLLSSPFL